LQQFYKIEALLKHSAGADILVIWDADCVPLKDIPLVTSSAKIVYMNVSKEFHKPYFENIHRLLGLNRVQDQTFVIPAFPIRSGWVSDLISFIESKHDCSWADAIIKTTDFSLLSGFSETETLGTWVVNSYPDAWVSGAGKWERLGQSRFGDVRSFNPKKLLEIGQKADLDIVTFERWDKRSLYSSLKRVATKFRTAIKNG
jgi:hypothetical protein